MKLLLDTHALLWWVWDDPKLGTSARHAIADPRTIVYVSAASAWEIAIKNAQGTLLPTRVDDLAAQLLVDGFLELAISVDDGLAAGALSPHHGDPFDRMLVAQAQRRGLTIVSHDRSVARYDVAVLAARS